MLKNTFVLLLPFVLQWCFTCTIATWNNTVYYYFDIAYVHMFVCIHWMDIHAWFGCLPLYIQTTLRLLRLRSSLILSALIWDLFPIKTKRKRTFFPFYGCYSKRKNVFYSLLPILSSRVAPNFSKVKTNIPWYEYSDFHWKYSLHI